jgi:hypothetical protein
MFFPEANLFIWRTSCEKASSLASTSLGWRIFERITRAPVALGLSAYACQQLVGVATYRTWLLYLAASAVNFEAALTGAAQVMFLKRSDFMRAHRE